MNIQIAKLEEQIKTKNESIAVSNGENVELKKQICDIQSQLEDQRNKTESELQMVRLHSTLFA